MRKDRRRMFIGGLLAVLAIATVVVAQSVGVSQRVLVDSKPKNFTIFLTPQQTSANVGDTLVYFAEAIDDKGNRIAGRPVGFRTMNEAGQPDTTVLVIRETTDTSAVVVLKSVGRAYLETFLR